MFEFIMLMSLLGAGFSQLLPKREKVRVKR